MNQPDIVQGFSSTTLAHQSCNFYRTRLQIELKYFLSLRLKSYNSNTCLRSEKFPKTSVFLLLSLESARARGRKGGWPPGLSKEAQVKAAAATSLYRQKQPIARICTTLGISKKTLYKYLKQETVQGNH